MARNKNKWILFNLIFYLSITFNANSQTPDWSYVNTGISHSFYFPADLIICSNDSVEPGDYVGVFYDSSGTFACGGYMIWNGGNQTLIAYGDDTLTTAKEGFSLEEETYWKTFHVAANLEYFHTALFAHDGFYPDSSCFVVNGASKLTYLGNCVAPVFISYTSSTSCFGDIDGSAWIDILVMNPPYTIEWSDGTLNDSIIDKSSGYYTLSVTNTMGFVTTETIFIPEPDSLEINYISSPVTQTGLPNGGIDLSISGGTSPYFFSWNNGAFAEDLENIFAGFYYVTVSDSQLCENNDSIEVITAFPDPWVIASSPISHDITIPENTLVHFNGESIENGDVIGVFYDSLGVLKCAGKYIYQDGFGSSGAVFSVVGNDNTTPQIEGFYPGGFFNWKIWDASEAIEIDVLTSYIDSLIWPDSCFFANAGHSAIKAINDIEHDMGISAWINPDDYCNLTNSEPIILEIFSNGMAQENSFTLKYNINGGPWFIQTIPQLVNYLDTFQFEIAYTANLGAEIDYHLKANISLSDDTNPHNDSIEIFLSPLKVIVATVPDTMGNCVGEAHLQISGGNPPYAILWNDPDTQTGPDAFNLCPGFYTAQIIDGNNCEEFRNIEIENTLPPNYNVVIGDVSCYGEEDGFINLNMINFELPLVFNWSNVSFSEDLSNIGPGTYIVTVSDGTSLSSIDTFIIAEPDSLEINYSVQDICCYGDANGSIDIEVEGGTEPYFYAWANGSQQADLSNIPAGNYILSVTDSHNCLTTQYVQILQPPQLVVNFLISDVSTAGAGDGSIFLSMFGATPPYAFLWNTGFSGQNIQGLDQGYYYLTVTDALNCFNIFDSIFIFEPYPVISGRVFLGPNPSPNGVVVLFEEFQDEHVEAIDFDFINNGYYSFSVPPNGKYMVYAVPNPDYGFNVYPLYFPTYFGHDIQWSFSTRIETETDYANTDIYFDSYEGVFYGQASISGKLSYTDTSVYESLVFDNNWFPDSGIQKSSIIKPAKNIPVLLLNENHQPVMFALCNDTGGFQLSNVEYGNFILRAEKAGYQSDEVFVSLSENQSKINNINLFIQESEIVIGIGEFVLSNSHAISFYPNPVKDKLVIKFPSAIRKIEEICVYNIDGEKIITMSGNEIVSKSILTINTSILAQGVYLLKIETKNNNTEQTKFIKL